MELWRIRTTVRDRPGCLAALASSLAEQGVNILSVEFHPVEGGAVDELIVDAPSAVSADGLAAAVGCGGGTDTHVSAADARALTDPRTKALRLAARLVEDTLDLPLVLADLLDDASVSWRPDEWGVTHEVDRTTLRLAAPSGGSLVVSRPRVPFTAAEFARARALVDLAAALTAAAARGQEPSPASTRQSSSRATGPAG